MDETLYESNVCRKHCNVNHEILHLITIALFQFLCGFPLNDQQSSWQQDQ